MLKAEKPKTGNKPHLLISHFTFYSVAPEAGIVSRGSSSGQGQRFKKTERRRRTAGGGRGGGGLLRCVHGDPTTTTRGQLPGWKTTQTKMRERERESDGSCVTEVKI